ncbi:MAG TPA: ketoreductase [Gammaproteobacteria bacterium]|nr:ketoreductase [Gammaproteobacteria bacterium]
MTVCPQQPPLVSIVTGASRGIGRAIALALAGAGHHVFACARSRPIFDEDVTGVAAGVGLLEGIACDLAERGAGARLVGEVVARTGRIDVLVNNAGIAPAQAMTAATPEVLDAVYALNMRAVHEVTWRAWGSLTATRGVILNVSSLAARDPFPGFQLYGASKAWLELYTRALADEGRAAGIRAYALTLGAVETALLRGLFPDFPSQDALATDAVAAFALRLLDPACAPASGEAIVLRR